jgi:signal transduction histidine kinase
MRRVERWGALTQWMSPLRDEQLPQLRAHLAAVTRHQAAAALVVAPLVLAFLWANGARLQGDAWGGLALYLGLTLALAAASLRWRGDRARLALLAAQSAWQVAALCASPWWTGQPLHPALSVLLGLPWVAALLTPVRPSRLLWSCAWFNACYIASVALFPAPAQQPPASWALAAVVHTAAALACAQLQRHLWLRYAWRAEQRSSADRLAQLGLRAAGLSHELKGPLATSQQRLAVAQELLDELDQSLTHPDVTDEDRAQIRAELDEALLRAAQAAQEGLDFLAAVQRHHQHLSEASARRFALQPRLQMGLGAVQARARALGVVLRLDAPHRPLWLEGDPTRLDQIYANLLQNALDAIEEARQGALIEVALARQGRAWVLRVRDDGPGVPAPLQARVFEPMFTTRGRQRGAGLGLSICRDIARGVFGGDLLLEDRGPGACFALYLSDGEHPS